MILLTNTEENKPEPCVATIGFFDGVHCGHQFLIQQVLLCAKESGLASTLITFNLHPRQVMQSHYQPQLLSTLEEKCSLLAATGADYCAVLAFTQQLAGLTAFEFMQQILLQKLNVRTLIIGYDHHFGKGGSEQFQDYVLYGTQLGIGVVLAKPYAYNGIRISSSVTRAFLEEGEVEMARRCLNRPYGLYGQVVHGFHIGRKLGFPTANLQISATDKLIPKKGVYAVRVWIDNKKDEVYPGMLNIGVRPTVDNGERVTIEVHLLDFSGDLYQHSLAIEFWYRLRDERRFYNTGELIKQLKEDALRVRDLFECQ